MNALAAVILSASLVAPPAMFSRAVIDEQVAALPSGDLERCLSDDAFTTVLVSKPDIVNFDCVEQAVAYFSVLKGDGIASVFYSIMGLAASHVGDLSTTKADLDAVDENGEPRFVETNVVYKDVEGLMILKMGMTITAAVAAGIRTRPSINYHGGGATVTKGKGSKWGTLIAIGINLAAMLNNLLIRK